jgi:hypothetical protein
MTQGGFSQFAQFLLSNYVVQIPILLVWIVGLVIAVIRWERYPRASLFATVALVIFIGRLLVNPLSRWWIQTSGANVTQIGARFAVLNVISSLVGALAWALLLAGFFAGRGKGIETK